tara:strand:- start:3022 stop:3687 length:666 start_codon:yes stop_codon:yes gene_type:complete
MTERKKIKLGPLYFLGFLMFFFAEESDILALLGMFTIAFTSLAHFIFKIVTQKDGIRGEMTQQFRGGITQQRYDVRRSQFSSSPRGTYHYDQLIRKMQVTDLSGMTVNQAATTYASFFRDPVVSAEPFFSNPYVKEVLKIGNAQVSAQAIAGSYSSTPPATSSSSGAFWSSMPESSTEAIEVCANPTCSTPVTVFDFRCYKCRNRFCGACKGDKITCQSCS